MTEHGKLVVADIGGTHARFARADGQGGLSAGQGFALDEFDSFEAAFAAYLQASGGPVEAAAIAVAAPVGDGQSPVRLTNAAWRIDPQALRARFALREVVLLNDFAALALSLLHLAAADLRRLCGGAGDPGAARAVLGPGTGLGVATLVRGDGDWLALAGEGGHVTLAAADAREAAIIGVARGSHAHVSAERLVSGSGMPLLYRCVCEVDGFECDAGIDGAEAVVGAAARGDLACRTTLDTFVAMLATVAGNLALTVGARGGVYLGGGILPRLGALLDAAAFARRFRDKGRFGPYLADVPVYVILAPTPALIGAAQALRQSKARAG